MSINQYILELSNDLSARIRSLLRSRPFDLPAALALSDKLHALEGSGVRFSIKLDNDWLRLTEAMARKYK